MSSKVSDSEGILAPVLSGAIIENAPTPLEGCHNSFVVGALVQILDGLAGLLLLRLTAELATQAACFAPHPPTIY